MTIDPDTIAELADLLAHLREHHGATTDVLARYPTLEALHDLHASYGGCQ